jgi:hypothetical protein
MNTAERTARSAATSRGQSARKTENEKGFAICREL